MKNLFRSCWPILLRGTVFNCAGGLVADGEATVYLDGSYYRTAITNGSFNIKVPRCKITAGTAKITALDYGTAQLSAEITQTVKDTLHDFGFISTCGTVYKRYMIVKFKGQTYTFLYPNDKFTMNMQNWLELTATNYGVGSSATLRWWDSKMPTPTNGPVLAPRGVSFFKILPADSYISYSVLDADMYITENITESQSPYQKYMSGFFSAMVKPTSGNDTARVPVTCSFRVRNAMYGDDIP